MTKTITLMNVEVANILGYLANKDCVLNNQDCPLNILWTIKKGRKKLASINESYKELDGEIDSAYNDDEHSYQAKDDTGHDIRKVKEKYLEEFATKKNELLIQKTEVTLETISIDDMMESEIKMKAVDLDMLSIFIDDTNKENE